ncbi:hypothetical protein GQ600_21945 [Phytophthora cactorum]|nr:hypothetical protein GQ600_21945 [Phytophthora cactorum]
MALNVDVSEKVATRDSPTEMIATKVEMTATTDISTARTQPLLQNEVKLEMTADLDGKKVTPGVGHAEVAAAKQKVVTDGCVATYRCAATQSIAKSHDGPERTTSRSRPVIPPSIFLEWSVTIFEELKLFGGIQVVSPAHSMSLELKRLELGKEATLVNTLNRILDNNQIVGVLDECGALQQLSQVDQVLHVSCMSPDYSTRLGACDGTRLNTRWNMDNAPFELMWLRSTAARGPLVRRSDKRGSSLLRLNISEQRQQYDQWFKRVKSGLIDEIHQI